nr:MAG TPA: hypothetical protein [Caudoviricetes sp.]
MTLILFSISTPPFCIYCITCITYCQEKYTYFF